MNDTFQFSTDYHCPIGELETVAPGLRRITANNPGPLTFKGTGTYVVGQKEVAVIDPGPLDTSHIDALIDQLGGERITHILITHTHRDHSAATNLLQQRCDAPSYALGTCRALQRPSALPSELDSAGDTKFKPDLVLQDKQSIHGRDWSLQCLSTPGHASNHVAFAEDAFQRVFVGDLVMGWSTPVLLPPDGHLADYLGSLERLMRRQDRQFWPTHGAPIEHTQAALKHLKNHRMARVESVYESVRQGHTTLSAIVSASYPDLSENLVPAALRSALASVVFLIEQQRLTGDLTQGLNITCGIAK